jgi:hypothetical protein
VIFLGDYARMLVLGAILAGCGSEVSISANPNGSGGAGGLGGSGGPGGSGGSGTSCSTDQDCVAGAEWCVKGKCVPCDNSGPSCDITCPFKWGPYERNGCFPCDCAPKNFCTSDSDCTAGTKCFAGAFCWDYCPPGDPSCCFGNLCQLEGCDGPDPTGCFLKGCPQGQQCVQGSCVPSACWCDVDYGGWACELDCAGGTCVNP